MMLGYSQGFPGLHWNMVMMILINLFVILVISSLGYFIFRSLFKGSEQVKQSTQYQPPQDALSILKERYARAEITREEYLRIREDLKQD